MINPDWPGWKRINQERLATKCQKLQRYDPTLEDNEHSGPGGMAGDQLPVGTRILDVVLATGWHRSELLTRYRLLALPTEMIEAARSGALSETQLKRLTDVVKSKDRKPNL